MKTILGDEFLSHSEFGEFLSESEDKCIRGVWKESASLCLDM